MYYDSALNIRNTIVCIILKTELHSAQIEELSVAKFMHILMLTIGYVEGINNFICSTKYRGLRF